MIRYRNLLYGILPAVFLLLSSCVRDVILDVGEKPTVVVECILDTDDVQELYLNFTKGASKEEADPVGKAVATLIDVTRADTVGRFKHTDGNRWTLDYAPSAGHHYRLEVEVPGYAPIHAEDSMPQLPVILERHRGDPKWVLDTTWTSSGPPVGPGGGMGLVPIQYDGWHAITDEEQEMGAYEYLSQKYGRERFWGSYYYLKSSPDHFLIYGLNYNEETGRHEMAESICTDHPSVELFNQLGYSYEPEKFFDEETGAYAEDVTLHPELKGVPLYDGFLCISAGAAEVESYFTLSGSFTGKWYDVNNRIEEDRDPLPDEGYLVVTAISENYRNYLRDACHMIHIKESTDMSAIYLRDNLYTNIHGGLGIFATSSSGKLQWARRFNEYYLRNMSQTGDW